MPSRYGVRGDLKCTIEVEMPTEEWAMGIAERGGVDNLRGLLPPRRPDLGPQAVGEGKETDTVELLEPQDHQDDEEEDYSWVRFFFFLLDMRIPRSNLIADLGPHRCTSSRLSHATVPRQRTAL